MGVDEVGRGCLAGPVVTAAVVFPDVILSSADPDGWWLGVNDSKLVAPAKREQLAAKILEACAVQIAWCYPTEIDRWNILHASLIAMRRALGPFSGLAQAVLVDGNLNPFEPRFRCAPGLADRLGFTHVELLVKGDSRSLSIAAASIVAKVYRDRWMGELDLILPGYSFGVHKGYSTPLHYEAIRRLGPCPIHRLSFAPFKDSAAGV
ncbi:MAG: ribonuclease HII [Deltaproteobacteria bacterium]|nr:ribonuclease HII [Deltaproteobacteria bacterium]